jgi:hypothetical protein
LPNKTIIEAGWSMPRRQIGLSGPRKAKIIDYRGVSGRAFNAACWPLKNIAITAIRTRVFNCSQYGLV